MARRSPTREVRGTPEGASWGYNEHMNETGSDYRPNTVRMNTRVPRDLADAVWSLNPQNKSDALRRVLMAGLLALNHYPTPQGGRMEG